MNPKYAVSELTMLKRRAWEAELPDLVRHIGQIRDKVLNGRPVRERELDRLWEVYHERKYKPQLDNTLGKAGL